MSSRASLGNLVQINSESTNDPSAAGLEHSVGLENIFSNQTRIAGSKAVGKGYDFSRVFRSGNVLVSKRNLYLCKTAIAEFDGVCSGDILVVAATHPSLESRFLGYLLSSPMFFSYAISSAKGTHSRRIRPLDLERFEFDLPPLDEQLRIVEVMRAVDREIEASENTLAPAREYVMALGRRLWEQTSKRVSILDASVVRDRERKPVSSAERAKKYGCVPYYGATGQVGTIDTPLFDEELLLVGEDGVDFSDPFRSSYRVSGPCWVNNHAHVLSAKNDQDAAVDLDLLHLILFGYQFGSVITGSTRSKLTLGELRKVEVPVIEHETRGRAVAEYRALMAIIKSDLVSSARALRTSLLQELIG
jgi:type I restriction enzyme S subunit